MKNNRGNPQKIKGIQDRKNSRHKNFSIGTIIGNRTFHSTDGLRFVTEHWLMCPESEHIRRTEMPDLVLPSYIQSKLEGLSIITSEYNWAIYIEFGHYEDGVSVSDGVILAEANLGDDNRHKTPYLTTTLRKFKADLPTVYEEISDIFWFNGSEPNSIDRDFYLHRAVYNWLTREPLSGLQIHHINHNGIDNAQDNMIALTPPIHALLHNGKTLDDLINDLHEIQINKTNSPSISTRECPPVTCVTPSLEPQGSHDKIPQQQTLFAGFELEVEPKSWNYWCDTTATTHTKARDPHGDWPNTA